MYDSKIQSPETDLLFRAILALKTEEDCYRFFEDVCTIKEIRDIAQRLEVARLLKSGETVAAIAQRTGASTTTVSRVNRCLHYGTGGYDLVMDKISK
ncbi:MAG: YerC/YecD family TrpR-related protein [Oscillospiraceae bacterium]|nr:YerC/YecD family TrpR-related protein [Oscillospiraceae bacterium]